MNLSEEQLNEIETLASCNYSPRQIAIYLGVPVKWFLELWHDEESLIRYHFDRGILLVQAKIDMKAATSAQDGNTLSARDWRYSNRLMKLENLKQALHDGEI